MYYTEVSYRTLIDCSTENLSKNFGLIAVFAKVAFEITKRAQNCVFPHLHVFVFFEIARVYLRLAGCRVYEGHLQNE